MSVPRNEESGTAAERVDPLFAERWSPRAFSSEPLSAADLEAIFEAARRAPSCFNDQPWLFVRATTTSQLDLVRGLLAPANRVWAERAPLLVVLFARKKFAHNGKPNRWGGFDAGAAWMSLALAAWKRGLAAHAMGGFDEQRATSELGVDPDLWEAMAVIAVGRRAAADTLPEPLASRELPSPRNPISTMVHDGPMTDGRLS